MLRWSTLHPVPLKLNCTGYEARSVAIGTDVLVLTQESDPKMFIFETDTGLVREIPNECFSKKHIRSMTHHKGHLYIWLYEKTNRYEEVYNHTLYDLNLKNQTTEEVMKLDLHYCRSETPIINGLMYVVEDFTDKMHVINLKTKSVNVITLKGDFNGDWDWKNLYVHKEKLYVVYKNYHAFNMSILENDQVKVLDSLSGGVYTETETRDFLLNPYCDWMGGTMLCEFGHPMRYTSLVTFDFEGLKWIKQEVEFGSKRSYEILTSAKVNGTIYVVTQKERDLQIRALEIIPKMSTLCLYSIIDRFIDSESIQDMEIVRNHVGLRHQLNLMLNWRLAKKIEDAEDEEWERIHRPHSNSGAPKPPIQIDTPSGWKSLWKKYFCC